MTAIVARPVSAQEDVDIQILQTAASLENLAVATYGAALGLPFIERQRRGQGLRRDDDEQHAEHGAAFNAQAEALGGRAQRRSQPEVHAQVVEDATPGLTDSADGGRAGDVARGGGPRTLPGQPGAARGHRHQALMASVMGVETQHLAILRAVGAAPRGAPRAHHHPAPTCAALPAAAGSVAFPEAFEEPDIASPPEEGAVQ